MDKVTFLKRLAIASKKQFELQLGAANNRAEQELGQVEHLLDLVENAQRAGDSEVAADTLRVLYRAMVKAFA